MAHRILIGVALLWLAEAQFAQAEVIACPATALSPPRIGAPEDVARFPGWQSMWTPYEVPLKQLDVYEEPPEIDLKRNGWFPSHNPDGTLYVIPEREQYAVSGRSVRIRGLETKIKTGTAVVFEAELVDPKAPVWMVCRYEAPFTLYRQLPSSFTRCENYRRKDARGRPTGPLVGECSDAAQP